MFSTTKHFDYNDKALSANHGHYKIVCEMMLDDSRSVVFIAYTTAKYAQYCGIILVYIYVIEILHSSH